MSHAHPFPRRGKCLGTLSNISRVLSATLDLHALYHAIDEQVTWVIPADRFAIELLDFGRDTLEIPYLRVDATVTHNRRAPRANTLTRHVTREGTPLRFHTRAEQLLFAREHHLRPPSESPAQSALIVPLSTGNRTIGAIRAETIAPTVYDPEDLETICLMASQAAVALENARLYSRSRESHQQMEALLHVARVLNSSHDLQSALESILLSMREVTPFAYAAIMLPDHAAGTLDIMGSVGPRAERPRIDSLNPTLKIPFGQGITGKVFESGRPLVVPDVHAFPGFIDHGMHRVRSEIAVPLNRGDTVVGVLDVGREGVDSFSPDDLDLLALFASQAAIAIENARLFSQQRQRAEEMQAIQSIIQKIGIHHDPREIAAVIVRELKDLIDYYECRVFLRQEDTDEILSLGEPPETAARLRLGEGFAGWIALHGRSDLIYNVLDDPRVAYRRIEPQPASIVGAPLLYEERVRGAITLSKFGTGQFDAHALRLLEIVAAQAAVALDRARLYNELRVEAITDPVVKLANRRYLMVRYKEERSRSERTGRPLACLMMDIDGFKRVNDTYGHDAGDAVLRELAGILRNQIRTEDIVARYGGEEFCVLLPESSSKDALAIGERLRLAIAEHPLPVDPRVGRITVSIGISLLSPEDKNTEMFSRADAAMYEAKAGGGNRLCLSATS